MIPYWTGKNRSIEDREKMSKSHIGKKLSLETRLKMSLSKRGIKPKNLDSLRSVENRLKISKAMKKRVAEGKHNFYIDGRVSERKDLRRSINYKIWRSEVFKRDNWSCVFCKKRSSKGNYVYLEADHIKPFAYFPELRFVVNNGRTLCKECHLNTDTYGRRAMLLRN